MILDNAILVRDFIQQFNCRFSTLDFHNNVQLIVDYLNKKNNRHEADIWLPCDDSRIFNQLQAFRYGELLKRVSVGIEISNDALDIFSSEMDDMLVHAFIKFLRESTPLIRVTEDALNNRFVITTHELLVNLSIPVFSQLHTETIFQLEYFNELVAINTYYAKKAGVMEEGIFTDNLYIQSRAATPFSYFLLAYIGENLGIKKSLQ